MMNTVTSAHWTDLLYNVKLSGIPGSQKKKKMHVRPEQREIMLNFILENPEMITHSSTRENEISLWEDLTSKLNAMLPEKPVMYWQKFWKRWVATTESKLESSLTMIDYTLKKFLRNISANNENVSKVQKSPIKKKVSIEEIVNEIKETEAEKTKQKLEIDKMGYAIYNHQTQIMELKKNISEKRKICHQLIIKKNNLNNKKRKLEEKLNVDWIQDQLDISN